MSVESDMDGIIVHPNGRVELDPPYGEGPFRTENIGVGLHVDVSPEGVTIFNHAASITLTIAELEELVRATARHGILNLTGGRS